MTVKMFFKSLVLKEEGKISVSKVLIWITAILAVISEANAQLISAGITIPPHLVPYIRDAAIISAILTAFRIRFGIGKITTQINAPTPVQPPAPDDQSAPPVPPPNKK